MNQTALQEPHRKNYSHIRSAIYGQPIAISESGLDLICGIIEARSEGIIPEFQTNDLLEDKKKVPHLRMVDDVAIISVIGPIFPRANIFTNVSGMTSAEGVMLAIEEAGKRNPSSYIFLFDSPGGAVSLGFECADKIFELRKGDVPVLSVIQGNCCSLAYLWASQAERVVCGVDSMVGSISVVMRAASDDRAMRNMGIDTLTMKSGNLKQMDDPATLAFRDQYQSLVNQLSTWHQMFVDTVQRGRTGMNAAARATGEIWIGQQSVDAGLADEVWTLDEVLKSL